MLTKEELIEFEIEIAACFDDAQIRAPVHLYNDNEEQIIEVDAFGAEGRKELQRRLIAEVLQARCEELLEMVRAEVRRGAQYTSQEWDRTWCQLCLARRVREFD